MRRLLMVALHYPPFAGSSSVHRTVCFTRHLPAFGWQPLVLTAHPRAHERVDDSQISDARIVKRAFALDAARHLSVMGHYPAFTARPDRWATWWFGAVPTGLAMIRKYRPDAIWSTYPVATAHTIARTLQRLSGLPWVADFRDPMLQESYPSDRLARRRHAKIEDAVFHSATRTVVVTPGAARMYRQRYPDARITVIENGYDEDAFARLRNAEATQLSKSGTFVLLHSGIVYPSERDPTQFFEALRRMRDAGTLGAGELRVRLRASTHEPLLRPLIERFQLTELVELAPPVPFGEAVREMVRADGLLVLQASNCNQQIPAKVYEYLRCRRPVMALTDPAGDTADLLRRAGMVHIARLDSAGEIALELRRFLDAARQGGAPLPHDTVVAGASRVHRARELAALLDTL